jgi:hypothetical protein
VVVAFGGGLPLHSSLIAGVLLGAASALVVGRRERP